MMIRRTDSTDPDFAQLVEELDSYLADADGADHSYYAQFNGLENISNVVVAYDGDTAVGCGAFKAYDRDTAEIKRMYVRPEFRGRRVGRIVLSELEAWAAESGFEKCILETLNEQTAAVRLYKGAGYDVIPNYDQYEGMEASVCMSKQITGVKVEER